MESHKFKMVPTRIYCFSGKSSKRYKKHTDLVPTQAIPKTNIMAMVNSTRTEKFITISETVYMTIVNRKPNLRPFKSTKRGIKKAEKVHPRKKLIPINAIVALLEPIC
jgi:hypothetical protein